MATNMETTSSQTMLAFTVSKAGETEGHVVEIPIPEPDRNYALIRVLYAGVCNTDLEILQGYMGFQGVLGHEFVGRVESIASDDDSLKNKWIGKRVCGDINVGCAECDVCHDLCGLDSCGCSQMSRNHCPNRTVLGILNKNGTMAEYLTLPISNLHMVPDDMPNEVAVFSEPLAAACRIVEQGLIFYKSSDASSFRRKPDRVAILGDGKLGLMIAEVLGREHMRQFKGHNDNSNVGDNKNLPPPPILFGKHKHKMDLVLSSGVVSKHVSECQDDSRFDGVHKDHSGKYDVVVDATGSPAGLKIASGLCRPMGTLVLKSTCAAGETFNAAPFVINELKVIGSRCGPINKALEILSYTKSDLSSSPGNIPLDVKKYVTQIFPLSQADKAIKLAAEKSTMKVLIDCT